MPSPSSAYQGTQSLATGGSDYNAIDFMVRQIMSGMATAQIVKVLAVSGAGGVALAGRLTVEIMVNQLDGGGNAIPSGTIYDVPYVRAQGGTAAVILDPKVGDIGICVFAAADISAVKATGKTANPGSFRRFSYSDGLYIGGLLNAVPLSYIMFASDGIHLVDPLKLFLNAPDISLTGATTITGTLTVTGATTLQDNVTAQKDVTVTQKLTAVEGEFGSGSQFVKLADGSAATKLKAS